MFRLLELIGSVSRQAGFLRVAGCTVHKTITQPNRGSPGRRQARSFGIPAICISSFPATRLMDSDSKCRRFIWELPPSANPQLPSDKAQGRGCGYVWGLLPQQSFLKWKTYPSDTKPVITLMYVLRPSLPAPLFPSPSTPTPASPLHPTSLNSWGPAAGRRLPGWFYPRYLLRVP